MKKKPTQIDWKWSVCNIDCERMILLRSARIACKWTHYRIHHFVMNSEFRVRARAPHHHRRQSTASTLIAYKFEFRSNSIWHSTGNGIRRHRWCRADWRQWKIYTFFINQPTRRHIDVKSHTSYFNIRSVSSVWPNAQFLRASHNAMANHCRMSLKCPRTESIGEAVASEAGDGGDGNEGESKSMASIIIWTIKSTKNMQARACACVCVCRVNAVCKPKTRAVRLMAAWHHRYLYFIRLLLY